MGGDIGIVCEEWFGFGRVFVEKFGGGRVDRLVGMVESVLELGVGGREMGDDKVVRGI